MAINYRFDIVTLFPKMVEAYFAEGIIAQGIKKGVLEIKIHYLRNYGKGNYQQVDDRVFGGGAGMVMMFEPIRACLEDIHSSYQAEGWQKEDYLTLATSAKGEVLKQSLSKQFQASYKAITLLCGRYEGFDQRIIEKLVDREISLGKFVLSGGELPAMAIVDSVARLIPGVLGKEESFQHDSFYEDDETMQFPQYTRPEVIDYQGEVLKVPPVLLSGNHAEIAKWRREN